MEGCRACFRGRWREAWRELYFSSSARGHEKGRGGRGRGRRRNHKDEEEEEQHKTTSGKAVGDNVDSAKRGRAKCKRCGETGHKSVRWPYQVCGVFDGKGHSVEICANVVAVLACEGIKGCKDGSDAAISGGEKGVFVGDNQAGIAMSRMTKGVVVRPLGKWGISRLFAIVKHRATCLTHQPE